MPTTPPTTIEEAITAQAIRGTKSASENGRSMQNRDIRELIEAERHIQNKRATAQPHFGLRFTKCVPPAGG